MIPYIPSWEWCPFLNSPRQDSAYYLDSLASCLQQVASGERSPGIAEVHSPERALGQACGVLLPSAPQTAATTAAAAGGAPERPPARCAAAAATSWSVRQTVRSRLSACSLAKRTPSESACSRGTSAWNAAGSLSPASLFSTSCNLRPTSA